jgi:hypothetical protein
MKKELLFIGLDVHAKNITIALAEGGGGEACLYGTIANDLHALEKVFAKLERRILARNGASATRRGQTDARRGDRARQPAAAGGTGRTGLAARALPSLTIRRSGNGWRS